LRFFFFHLVIEKKDGKFKGKGKKVKRKAKQLKIVMDKEGRM